MNHVLLSSTGNLIESYDEESEARAALQQIIDAEPEAARDVALLSYGEDGMPVGDPVFASTPTGVR
jgi:hypothetical protein